MATTHEPVRLALRKLWSDHVIWTRDYIVAAVDGRPDQKAAARRQLALVLASRGGYGQTQNALKLVDSNLQARPDSQEDRRLKALLLALGGIQTVLVGADHGLFSLSTSANGIVSPRRAASIAASRRSRHAFRTRSRCPINAPVCK